jgi:hypothetical protein
MRLFYRFPALEMASADDRHRQVQPRLADKTILETEEERRSPSKLGEARILHYLPQRCEVWPAAAECRDSTEGSSQTRSSFVKKYHVTLDRKQPKSYTRIAGVDAHVPVSSFQDGKASTGTIAGKVVSQATGTPLADAIVKLHYANRPVRTLALPSAPPA